MIRELTEDKAVELSVEMWRWLAATGASRKSDWPGLSGYDGVTADCFLCEYNRQRGGDSVHCQFCPLNLKFGLCNVGPCHFWHVSVCKADRIKFAREFLVQLEEIR